MALTSNYVTLLFILSFNFYILGECIVFVHYLFSFHLYLSFFKILYPHIYQVCKVVLMLGSRIYMFKHVNHNSQNIILLTKHPHGQVCF
jgi:hypothetical protein